MNIKPHKPTGQQRGISLFVVLVIVMLSALLAMWASRTSLFNEIIVGNDADQQRAFEAAQALIQDAELDIRRVGPDGQPCVKNPQNPEVCRVSDPMNKVWIPIENRDLADIFSELESQPTKCLQGLCLKRTGQQDFWNDKATLAALMKYGVGARYGQFTGAETGTNSNPILKINKPEDSAEKGGWYWIEILPYDSNAGNSTLITEGQKNLALNLIPHVVYRITVIAHGLKPTTRVVLQTTFVLQKMKN